MRAPPRPRGPRVAALTTLALLALLAACRGDDGPAGGGPGASDDGGPIGSPELVRPDRDGYVHDVFLITGSGAGRAFRVRLGEGRPPQVLGASLATFYDGSSLARFGRLALERDEPLENGGRYLETRVRLWEEDGFGTGRWVHEHGAFQPPLADPSADCDLSSEACLWVERSGMDLVSIVGDLRGVRSWSGGHSGAGPGWSRTRYSIHNRLAREEEFLRLWGPAHKELVREARERFDAMPADKTSCYAFDYRSSYLRPAPGGLVWVMHATPRYEACQGTVIPIEVEAPLPRHGGIELASFGDPGDVFHYGPPDVWVEPDRARTAARPSGRGVVVRTADAEVALPGGGEDDPPLGAIHWMREADIPEQHRAALELAYTEIHDLIPSSGPAPVVDGRLDEWDGAPMLLLDATTNVSHVRYGTDWDGPADASLAVGARAAGDDWVIAARVTDDVRTLAADGRLPRAVDHLQLWVRGHDGWVRLRVEARADAGDAPVEADAFAADGEQERDITASQAAPFEAARAALRPYDGGLDVEVLLPAAALRDDDGKIGLRVLYADADGESELEGDVLIGTAAPLVDAWLRP